MSKQDQREADLARMIAGEVDAESEEGQAALRASGMSLEEFEGFRQLAERLDAVAAERDTIGDAASGMEHAPGLERVEGTLARLAGAQRSSPWTWLWPAAAILLLLPLLLFRDEEPKRDPLLGDADVHVELVGGAIESHGAIEITLAAELDRGEVELYVYGTEDHLTPIKVYAVQGTRWSDPEEQRTWPRSVFIRVVVHLPGQGDVVSNLVESSLD